MPCFNAPANLDDAVAAEPMENVVIELQKRNPAAKPATPTELFATEYDPDYESFAFDFKVSPLDVDGNLLDTDELYYVVYIDGEEFTFQTDEYDTLEENMTLVHYDFDDGWYFYPYGDQREIAFMMEGVDKIGVQMVYFEEDEATGNRTESRSEIASYTVDVKTLAADSDVKTVSYYDLQGRAVRNPAKGIYIVRKAMTDGSVRTSKAIIK